MDVHADSSKIAPEDKYFGGAQFAGIIVSRLSPEDERYRRIGYMEVKFWRVSSNSDLIYRRLEEEWKSFVLI